LKLPLHSGAELPFLAHLWPLAGHRETAKMMKRRVKGGDGVTSPCTALATAHPAGGD
jgi:hypothetical protein